jgi:hypothetical protein
MKNRDEGMYPNSVDGALDRAGIRSRDFHDKHGRDDVEYVANAEGLKDTLNHLPPGTQPEEQHDSMAAQTADRFGAVKYAKLNPRGVVDYEDNSGFDWTQDNDD